MFKINCTILFILKLFFLTGLNNNSSGLKIDSSVRVSHLNREVVVRLLKEIKGLVREDYSEAVLKKTLAKELKDRHAIHDKLKMLSYSQLAQLCGQFSLHGIQKQRYKPRMMKAISKYCFEQYPDAPLTNLQRFLEKDNTSQLTSGKEALRTGIIYKFFVKSI